MAKNISVQHLGSKRRKHPGVHSKSKCSKLKGSKNYKKRYRGQGRA